MLVNIDAEKLKQLRESRCWSQQQLADLCGLSLRTVQRVEAKAVASQESVKCLAATFDVPTHFFIKDSVSDTVEPNTVVSTTDISNTTTGEEHNDTSDVNEDPDPLPGNQQTPAKDDEYQQKLRTLYIGFAIVFASHLFGFFGIFTAFDEGRISEDTFQILKNSLSIVLIVSAIILFLKDKQIKKKHASGSSL